MLPLNMKIRLVFCFLIIVLVSSFGCGSENTPQSQADKALLVRQAHYYKVVVDEKGKYWFQDPNGRKFLSIGIDGVYAKPEDPKPGSQYYNAVDTVFGGDFSKWKEDVISIMQRSGFNTFGAWSEPRLFDDNRMYSTMCLYVASHHWERCMDGFLPDFEQRVRDNVNLALKGFPNIDNVFGVFLDNEMRWYGKNGWDVIPNYTLLEKGLEQQKDSPYYKIASKFLIDKYKTVEAFSKAWGKQLNSWDELNLDFVQKCINDTTQADRDEFTALAAEKFYSGAAKVVREMLPGKLILGTRFAQKAPESVIRACGKYCDVISFNDYRALPEADEYLLARYWVWGGKPLMVTEYSWRGKENNSGNPNTRGAGAVVETQAQRGANYQKYVEDLLSYPMVIGAHWFEFADQSPQGRGPGNGGEDSNYGIVDINHKPYKDVINAMTETNGKVAKIHAESAKILPKELPKPPAVVFEPGQHPDRPPFVDLLKEEPIRRPGPYNADDAKISIIDVNGVLAVEYVTGQTWGGGFSVYGPKKLALGRGPDFAVDLDGYSVITIDAEIPKGFLFEVFFDEAGVAPPDSGSFNIAAGDDGESFTFPPAKGKGERAIYRFDLKDLLPRTSYGNQKGKRHVDLNAAKGPAFYFPGMQGDGTIKFYSIKFEK
jgi:hypothetical protein